MKDTQKNSKIPVLTPRTLILPLRDIPGVVSADSASESSDTSSEHHCMHAVVPNNKRQMITIVLSKDRSINAHIRISDIRKQDTRARN